MLEFARNLIGLNIFLLLLLSVSFPYLQRGTATYFVAVLSIVVLVVSTASVAVFVRRSGTPSDEEEASWSGDE